MPELTPKQRAAMRKPAKADGIAGSLVSRAAMLVLGLGLLFGAYKCWQAYNAVGEAMSEVRSGAADDSPVPGTRGRANRGEGNIRVLPLIGMIALGVGGTVLALGSLTPMKVLERFVSP